VESKLKVLLLSISDTVLQAACRSRFFVGYDMQLAVKTQGDGPPLVLLHGGMGSINHWHRNIDVLARRYTAHALDMPGYGESPTVPKDMPNDDYVALVVEALNATVPAGTFRLAGFSFGGIISALCAAQLGTRIEKLSLMGPGGFRRLGAMLDLRKIPPASEGMTVMREVLAHNLRTMMCAGPVTDETIDLHLANVQRTRYDGRHFSLTPGLMAKCLRQITCPVQIIWGEKDALCYPSILPRVDEVRAAMPDIRIDVVKGGGHWVQYDAADEVNRLLLDFLK
jgi:2-hydroxy-6-oxonona-2,4-dienedioate hydrolase